MISKNLQNNRFKEFALKRIYEGVTNKKGYHKFTLESPTCSQCSTKFYDWLEENPDGSISRGAFLCPVIGRDEVDSWGSEVIRGDDGGY